MIRRHCRSLCRGLLLLALVAVACGDAPPDADPDPDPGRVEVTDSAGVAIVRSLSGDRALQLETEPVLTLGGRDTPKEAFYTVARWNVGAGPDGAIHVLDRDANLVQVYDTTGRHLRTMGGQGSGPGELRMASALTVSDDGSTWVADAGRRALIRWGPMGELQDETPFPDGYLGGEVSWTPGGLVTFLRGPDARRIALVPPSGERAVLASLPDPETTPVTLESCAMQFAGMEPIFSPNLVWAVSGNTVVVALNPDYALDVFLDGRHVQRLERALPRHAASAELARASLGEGLPTGPAGEGRVCDAAEVVEKAGVAPYLPAVERIARAPDGTLWVQRYAVEPEVGGIDIFDPEGRYAGTLPEGSPFPIGFLPDGRILTSEVDELAVERLVVRTAELTVPGR